MSLSLVIGLCLTRAGLQSGSLNARVHMQMPRRHEITVLPLLGLPALQRCHISFHNGGAGMAMVALTQAGPRCQQDSLQSLTLRSAHGDVRLVYLSPRIVTRPALRHLTVQNLRLTHLDWLDVESTSRPPAPLRSLDLDGNDALQLSRAGTAALCRMTALEDAQHAEGVC